MKRQSFKPVSPNVNFPEMEKKLLAEWYEHGIVDKYLHRNDASTKRFSFLDGPITANNPMGVHHAWGRTFKDLWQRFYAMRGYKERFQNGFDCQGLWVEVEVEKELGVKNKKDIENLVPGDKKASIAKFVELCKARVRKFSSIQTEQSKRLGYFMDWNNSYFTMSDENNYMIWHFLKTCFEKGWMYKGRDSVPWCPRCETAISQHEMLTEDYKEVMHKAIYFELPIIGRNHEYLLVWTTTPWTIPANIAVAVDEKIEYSLIEGNSGDIFWIAKERVDVVFGKEYKKIVKTVLGKELVRLTYRAPFDNLPAVQKVAKENPKTFHTVIATDPLILPITMTEGTGLVHTAVSAGAEDFKLGKKYGLPMIPVIADNADYLPDLGFLSGKNAKKHPEVIFDYLIEREKTVSENWVFKIENYTHRYPACWRCKTELVWKVADAWYIAMDKVERNGKKTLREQMMEVAKKIDWHPSFGLERELDWLANMHDWLISKPNRYWGLALPIYECQKCGWFTVLGSKEELKKKAIVGWEEFEGHSPHKPFIDEIKIKCEQCGDIVSRLNDVGNVWLDAGIVPFSTYVDPQTKKLSYTSGKKYWQQWFPADFITESFPGQFKNWFYSMIAMATVLEKKNPYKTVLGYASMLGEDGRPMHKSWGNAIEFNEGAEKIGADVMRWMFATHDPEQNLLFGYKRADETRRKFHLLLWNVYNFFVTYANAHQWNPKKQYEKRPLHVLDRWILSRLNGNIKNTTKALREYDVRDASGHLEILLADLSLLYIQASRNRVDVSSQDYDRSLATLYEVLEKYTRMLAPFCPFLADEIYSNLTKKTVNLADWPQSNSKVIQNELERKMTTVINIVSVGRSLRKQKGVKTRQPLSSLKIITKKLTLDREFESIIKELLNIKNIIWSQSENFQTLLHDTNSYIEDFDLEYDFEITPELQAEGEVRELIRQIQLLRKEKGCRIDERVTVQLPKTYEHLQSQLDSIKKETLATTIVWGESLNILTG